MISPGAGTVVSYAVDQEIAMVDSTKRSCDNE